jgi:predicted permease
MLETVCQDIRYGARMLRHNLGFSLVAVVALGIGIGLTTAVFTAYKTIVARPIQARNPDEMANLALVDAGGVVDYTFSYPDYESYRDSIGSFSGLIAASHEQMRLTAAGGVISKRASEAESGLGRLGLFPAGASNAEFASVLVVSENYFQVLGVRALRGRTFESMRLSEISATPPVLVSENFWQKRFGGDPGVLGRTMKLNGVAVTIAGITPHDFVGTFAAVPDFWLPTLVEPLAHGEPGGLRDRGRPFYRVFGRLAPGASIAQAQAETTLVANRLRSPRDSQTPRPVRALVFPGTPFPVPLRMNRPLMVTILFIAVAAAMVLAVACADVGSLQLIRARARQQELETRLALGASRTRVIRQLLTESALLGMLAGAVAFPFTWVLLKAGVTFAAGAFPAEFGTFAFDVTPNLAIFGFVFAISLAAGIFFGLAPAMESSQAAIVPGPRGSTLPARSRRTQDWMVAAQVALTLVLLLAGSMLVHSAINSLAMATGYAGKQVVAIDLQFPEGAKYAAAHKLAVVRELRARLAALPGVSAVTSARPPGDYGFLTAAAAVEPNQSTVRSVPPIHYKFVQPDYFQTLGIALLAGRGFESSPERALVLSEAAARQLCPGGNPAGCRIRLGATDEQIRNPADLRAEGPVYEVAGVVRDVRGLDLNGGDSRLIYLAAAEDRLAKDSILLRTRTDPALAVRAIDSAVAAIDPDLTVTSSTLDDELRRSPAFIISSLAAVVASSVGLLGLVLAFTGIYGTVGYIVQLRTREIGIRMAVGAQKRDIVGVILGESARPVFAGLLAGMLLALAVSSLLRGLLYGLGAVDAFSFAAVSMAFLAIALAAAYPACRRASRVDPIEALRCE